MLLKESPEYVRLSLASAMTLRFVSGRFYRDAKLHCINLLLTYSEGCLGRCSYCGLSKDREGSYEDKSFIRVRWDTYKMITVLERLKAHPPCVKRVCISMITNKRAIDDTISLTKLFKEEIDLPISLLISPTIVNKDTLRRFKNAGADMIGVALDTATEKLFIAHRGKAVNGPHKWEGYWQTLEEALEVFGRNKVGCHLIVGLGETEQQMVETLQKVRDMGAESHLFSFYPERGSLVKDKAPCPVGQYRRVQLARYLINNNILKKDKMEFDLKGRIVGFGLDSSQLDEIINSGKPFQTSGCPSKTKECACNRPFGDGPPSNIRSFPFELDISDIRKIRNQIGNIRRCIKNGKIGI